MPVGENRDSGQTRARGKAVPSTRAGASRLANLLVAGERLLARRRGLDRDVAADLAQEAALQWWSQDPSGGGTDALYFAILRRRSIDYWRGEQQAEAFFPWLIALVLPPAAADEPLLERDLAESVRAAVATLAEPERSLVSGRYFEGRTLADLARRQRLSPDAVRRALARALDRLRGRLRECAPPRSPEGAVTAPTARRLRRRDRRSRRSGAAAP